MRRIIFTPKPGHAAEGEPKITGFFHRFYTDADDETCATIEDDTGLVRDVGLWSGELRFDIPWGAQQQKKGRHR